MSISMPVRMGWRELRDTRPPWWVSTALTLLQHQQGRHNDIKAVADVPITWGSAVPRFDTLPLWCDRVTCIAGGSASERARAGYRAAMTDNRGYESDVEPDDAEALVATKAARRQRWHRRPQAEERSERGAQQSGTGVQPTGPAAPADQNSTTGTTPNEDFVGRVSGDDGGGYEGETGAEARAAGRSSD